MGRLVHRELEADLDTILPSSIPAMERSLLQPARSAAAEQPKRKLPDDNPFAVALSAAFQLLEQRIEVRASSQLIRDAETALEAAEIAADKELRRVERRERMEGAANLRRAEQRERERRAQDRAAEERVRATGPVLELRYRGIVIRAYPEKGLDPVARANAFTGFAESFHACRVDCEERQLSQEIARVRGGQPTMRPWTVDRLALELQDIARRGIGRGLIEILREDTTK